MEYILSFFRKPLSEKWSHFVGSLPAMRYVIDLPKVISECAEHPVIHEDVKESPVCVTG